MSARRLVAPVLLIAAVELAFALLVAARVQHALAPVLALQPRGARVLLDDGARGLLDLYVHHADALTHAALSALLVASAYALVSVALGAVLPLAVSSAGPLAPRTLVTRSLRLAHRTLALAALECTTIGLLALLAYPATVAALALASMRTDTRVAHGLVLARELLTVLLALSAHARFDLARLAATTKPVPRALAAALHTRLAARTPLLGAWLASALVLALVSRVLDTSRLHAALLAVALPMLHVARVGARAGWLTALGGTRNP